MEQNRNPYFSVALLLITIAIGGLVIYYIQSIRHGAPAGDQAETIIIKPRPQEKLPPELMQFSIVDDSVIRVYDIQNRSLADGGVQYVAHFDTNDLKAEYEHAKQALQSNKQFFLQSDSLQGNNFALSWSRSIEQLQITGISNGGLGGTVILSYYKRL